MFLAATSAKHQKTLFLHAASKVRGKFHITAFTAYGVCIETAIDFKGQYLAIPVLKHSKNKGK